VEVFITEAKGVGEGEQGAGEFEKQTRQESGRYSGASKGSRSEKKRQVPVRLEGEWGWERGEGRAVGHLTSFFSYLYPPFGPHSLTRYTVQASHSRSDLERRSKRKVTCKQTMPNGPRASRGRGEAGGDRNM